MKGLILSTYKIGFKILAEYNGFMNSAHAVFLLIGE